MKRITEIEGMSALGPYSFAIVANDTVYTAGQIGQKPEGGLAKGGIEAQAHQVMANLAKVLKAAGTDFEYVIKTTIYLTDLADFAKVNEVYANYFSEGEYPARETTEVAALPLGARVEMSMIATLA
jgi:2-iminobutanoate/2-iminopropanoate deaminase